MSFANKVILITGASSGIGADAAQTFAKLSANLALVGRNRDNLERVAAACQQSGAKAIPIVADVSKDDDVRRILDETIDAFGRLDVLVNNAGFGASAKFEDGLSTFDSILATNLRGVYSLTALAAPHLEATKGNVINISSIAAYRPVVQFYAYCISKAALDMMTKCAALELAQRGIRVNSVNPGATRTKFLHTVGMSDEKAQDMFDSGARVLPLKQVAEGQDIANAIVYLAGEQARCITGVLLTIDNGAMLMSPSLMDQK